MKLQLLLIHIVTIITGYTITPSTHRHYCSNKNCHSSITPSFLSLSSSSSVTKYHDNLIKENNNDFKIKNVPLPSNNNNPPSNKIPKVIPKLSTIIQNYKTEPWKANATISRITQQKLKSLMPMVVKEEEQYRIANEILYIILSSPMKCNEMNLVYAITSCAKIISGDCGDDVDLKIKFVSRVSGVILVLKELIVEYDQLSGRELANIAWALVRLKKNSINCNNASWDELQIELNKVEKELNDLLQIIAIEITKYITQQKLKPMELCMIAWAYATYKPRSCPPGWQYPSKEITVSSFSSNPHHFDAKDDISFLYANDYFFNHHDNQYYEEYDGLKQRSNDTVMMELFNSIAFAFTNNNQTNETKMLLNQCTLKELSVLAWSYAHHGHDTTSNDCSEKLIQSITSIFITRLEENNTIPLLPRDISLLAWSLGILQADNFIFGTCLIDVIQTITKYYLNNSMERPFRTWENTDLVQLANTLGRARIDSIVVLKSLYEEIVFRIQQQQHKYKKFASWELTSLLYIQARLYLTSKQDVIFDIFKTMIPDILLQRLEMAQQNYKQSSSSSLGLLESIGMKSQEQANLAWSLTVLKAYKNEDSDTSDNASMKLIHHILSAASQSTIQNNNPIQIEHAHQLWQTLFLVNDENNHGSSIQVNKEFRTFLEQKWKMEKTRHKISSARHKALSQTLNFMGVLHYNEHDEDIDVAIVLKDTTSCSDDNESLWTSNSVTNTTDDGKEDVLVSRYKVKYKVAVEFDGPGHFTRIIEGDEHSTYPPRALGHTVLKYRLLKKQGWTVVRVPFYEYDKIPYWASMERQRYLQRLLKTHDVIRFSDTDVSEYKAIVNNRQSRYD